MVPKQTSAPISPGGVISVSASRSAPTATSAPRSWPAATSAVQSTTVPPRAGQLRDHAEELAVGQAGAQVGLDDLDAERLGAGREHGGGLREQVGVDDEAAVDVALCPRGAAASSPRRRRCASSSIDALATSMPVRSATMVWKLSSASSRPWLISGWYGV